LPLRNSNTIMAKVKVTHKDTVKPSKSPVEMTTWPAFFNQPKLIGAGIFVLALLLYAYTATFGFVMDDAIVITDNMFTQKGMSGIDGILTKDTFFGFFKEAGKETVVSGGRYRPFTLVIFAMMYSVFGGASATPYHILTILLYALTCWMVFQCVRVCLKSEGEAESPRALAIAAITALLFAVHPVHVEVVANIKGCDEIVSLLGSIAALYFTVRAYDSKRMGLALVGGLVFLTGLFSKENAFMFVALIPAALLLFRRASIGDTVRYAGPSMAAGLLFFVVRGTILQWKFGATPGDLMNNPFLKIKGNIWVPFDAGEKLGTILHTLTLYIKLMFVPHPLTHDYYPRHIDVKGMGDPLALLALVLYGGMFYLMYKLWNKGAGITFGILAFLLTLFIVSNFIFPIGTNMGERFLFMPSFGLLLAVSVYLVDWAIRSNKIKSLLIGVGVVAGLFALKTLTRQPVWESNEKLFLSDVLISKRSAKLLNAAGGTLYDKGIAIKDQPEKQQAMLNQAIPYLNAALEVHPTYKNAYLLRANCLFYLNRFEESYKDYKEALRIDPEFKDAKTNLSICLREAGKKAGEKDHNLEKALTYLTESYQLNPKDAETLRLLGVANGVKGNHPEALDWFIKALALDPENPRLLYDLGTAYQFANDPARAAEYQQKALKIKPDLLTAPPAQ
jgi:protein O-mannosyl-transferase